MYFTLLYKKVYELQKFIYCTKENFFFFPFVRRGGGGGANKEFHTNDRKRGQYYVVTKMNQPCDHHSLQNFNRSHANGR